MQSRLGKKNVYKLSPGNKFRQYRIENVLGKGAMGVVYKAFDEGLQRHVALKVLQTNFIGDKEHKQFVREVKAIANLNHDNIVKLYEVGTEPTHYFTMEYINGETLAQVLKNESLSHAAIARIVSKIALGLYHAHIRGVVHGDIKPENIMITHDREPKIMDFGLAKDHNSSQVSQDGIQGTPAYLAPEQLQSGSKVDKRVDVYALGVTLYRALSGELPFNEKNYVSLFYQIINETPRKLCSIDSSISPDLELICEKCMQKSPQKRYANARFLARDLQNFLVGRPLWAASSSSVFKFVKHVCAFWWMELLCGISCIYLMILAIISLNAPTITKKTFTKEEQQRFSAHQKKSQELSPWYRGKNYEIDRLQLLSQRMGFGDKLWKKDVDEAINNIYRQIRKAPNNSFELAIQLLQIIIELQQGEYINDNFSDVCIRLRRLAKKNNLQDYVVKFEQFSAVHRVHQRLRAISDKYQNDLEKHKEEKRIVAIAMNKTTNPHGYFYLACHTSDVWLREKLLLRAVSGAKNYRFYGKLGDFYINNHFYHEGIALCRRQLQYNPYEPLAHYHIARGLISVGDYENALEHLQFLEKNYFNTGKELLFFEKTRIFVMEKKYSLAKKALQDAHLWVQEHGESLGNFKDTHERWSKLIAGQDFWSGFPAGETARWYYRIGKLEKAYKFLRETEHRLPLQLAIYRAILEKKIREFDTADQLWKEAYDFITRVLKREEQEKTLTYSAILYRYAFELLTSRHSQFYKTYTEQKSNNLQLLHGVGKKLQEYYFVPFYRALFLKGKGNYAQAITLCHEAKKIAPWYRDKIELVEKISLARWYQYSKVSELSTKQKTNIAIKLATEMVQGHNYDPAHNLLGFIYIYSDIDKAQYHFEQIQEDKISIPDRLDFYFDSAYMYAEQKMYDKATKNMEKYLKLNPDFIHAKQALQNFREKQK